MVEDIERDIIGGSAAGRRVERTKKTNETTNGKCVDQNRSLARGVAKSAYFLPSLTRRSR